MAGWGVLLQNWTMADRYEALSAKRPYWEPHSREKVLCILRNDVPKALDKECFAVLEACEKANWSREEVLM